MDDGSASGVDHGGGVNDAAVTCVDDAAHSGTGGGCLIVGAVVVGDVDRDPMVTASHIDVVAGVEHVDVDVVVHDGVRIVDVSRHAQIEC